MNKNNPDITLIEKIFNHKYKIISYFQRDITKFKILIAVMKNYNNDSFQNIEELIEQLPKISSRAHKLNSITEATNLGYLIKETSKSDQRKKYLRPSDKLINEYKLYLDEIFE